MTPPPPVPLGRPLRDSGTQDSAVYAVVRALGNWLRAVALEAMVVAVLWLVGLLALHVPYAPLWAGVAAVFQFMPVVGGLLTVAGPAITAFFGQPGDRVFHLCMVLGLYAAIMVVTGLLVEPYVLHRTTLVPWWAALLGPVVLGLLIPPWGVLLAPPLLAVGFALVGRRERIR